MIEMQDTDRERKELNLDERAGSPMDVSPGAEPTQGKSIDGIKSYSLDWGKCHSD